MVVSTALIIMIVLIILITWFAAVFFEFAGKILGIICGDDNKIILKGMIFFISLNLFVNMLISVWNFLDSQIFSR